MRPDRAVPLLAALAVLVSGCTVGLRSPATGVSDTGATLRAVLVASQAGEVEYWFRYGPTTSYGTETPHRTRAVSGQDSYRLAEPVTGLTPGTTYHFQACVRHETSEPDETNCVGDSTFTTATGPDLTVSVDPSLYPAFNPAVSDYVTRCYGDPVSVDVVAPGGSQVSVAGQPAATGSFSQEVPLSTGQGFDVTVTGTGAATYHVRCLPLNFPNWTFERSGTPTQQWTLLALSKGSARYVTFVDANGTPVWWLSHPRVPLDAHLLSDDTVAFARGEATPFGTGDTAYEIHRLDGSLVRELKTVGSPTDHHELQQLASGNYLLATYKPREHADLSQFGGPADAKVLDSVIQELTPQGDLVWSWNSKDHIALSETSAWWETVLDPPPITAGAGFDLVHINAIEVDGDSLLVSMRHTDAIYRIRRSDGAVLWKLGGTTTPESLTVEGDPRTPTFSGQHDVHRLADGTITVYDNGTKASRAPRGVRFSIDAAAGTATWLGSVTDPLVTGSLCCGSARRLASGGWLVGWGSLVTPVISEYASDGTRLTRLRYPDAFSYRAIPVSPGQLDAAQLRAGMDAMAAP
jgi:hypothetical protein